jgi:hypothetical protein
MDQIDGAKNQAQSLGVERETAQRNECDGLFSYQVGLASAASQLDFGMAELDLGLFFRAEHNYPSHVLALTLH